MLSNTAAKIIWILVKSNNDYKKIKELAILMNLSERSIYLYLEEVIDYLTNLNLEIIEDSRKGVMLCIDDEKKENLLRKIKKESQSVYTPDGRKLFIIKELLFNKQMTTIVNLSDLMFSSNSQTQRDLKEVEIWLEDFDISLHRKTGTGIHIKGREKNIRNAMVKALHMNIEFDKKESEGIIDEIRVKKTIAEKYSALVGTYNYNNAILLLRQFEARYGKKLTRGSFLFSLEYYCILLFRLEKGNFIEDDEKFIDLHNDKRIKSIIVNITFIIAKFYERNIGDGEFKYIYSIMMSCDFIEENEIVLNQELEKLTLDSIEVVSNIMRYPYKNNRLLLNALYVYYSRAIYRLYNDFIKTNKDKNEIKLAHPQIFNAVIFSNYILEERIGVKSKLKEDEIAMISQLYSLVIQDYSDKEKYEVLFVTDKNNYFSSLYMNMVQDNFSKIKIIEKIGCLDCSYPGLKNEIIISTIDLPFKDKHVCKVSGVFSKDYAIIENFISDLDRNYIDKSMFESIFDDKYILLGQKYKDKEDLIKRISDLWVEDKIVKKGFDRKVLEREELSSTYVGNAVATPHTVSNLVIKPKVFIVSLKEKMDWDGDLVDIVFVLALDFKRRLDTEFFSRTLLEISRDEKSLNIIRNSKNKKQIKKVMKRWYE